MKIINKLLVFGLGLTVVSCTGDYLEINSNPYQPGDLTADGYALTSAMNNIASTVVPADVNCCQFTDCLLGGTLGGYFSDANSNFTQSIIRYNAANNWTRVFLVDEKIISTFYANETLVEALCEASGDVVPLAVTKIVKVATMSRVTDCYGPIPFSKIGENGALQTPYDSQEDIYNEFFRLLTEAVATLQIHEGEPMASTTDYVYGGNPTQWIRFANSLKLRLAMRIVYANPTLAQQMAEEAVDPAKGGVIESNADNASWKYFTSNTNPFYVAVNYNSNGSTTGGDTHAAADIICYMNGYNDPRRDKFFSPSLWPGYNFLGLRRGWTSFNADWGFNFSGVNVKATDPIVWMNAAEVAFLRAEAAGVFGFNVGGDARTFYETGIQLSFDQWGAGSAASYIADDTSRPATYVDPSNVNPWNGALSTITIKWDDAASTEEMQERIITQKWIANWMLGNEAWADYRRTGYPRMIPVAFNGSNGIVDSATGPQRMAYPQEEYTNNAANVTAAVQNLLGGPDNMATRLWWACKPINN